jgi:hypothetical protein
MKMDELTDKWTIFLSASWSNESTREQDFDLIKRTIKSKFSQEESSTIARIGIFDKNEPSVQAFLTQYKEGAVIKESPVNGFIVHEGFVLLSKNDNI